MGNEINSIQIEQFIENFKNENSKEVISISTTPNKPVDITSSKFGGTFYLPKNAQIPTNNEDEQLTFLAQINCKELPENNIYPKEGIVQFWIYGGSQQLGADFMDFDSINNNKNKRVIYYPTIEDCYSKEEINSLYQPKGLDGKVLTPLQNGAPFALSFKVEKQPITVMEYSFNSLFNSAWNEKFPSLKIEEEWPELEEVNIDVFNILEKELTELASETQIGGYGYFTQWDPRTEDHLSEYNVVLLQIDTDYGADEHTIMWGDGGIGNFFIQEDKLKQLDFSNVLYNWDCF